MQSYHRCLQTGHYIHLFAEQYLQSFEDGGYKFLKYVPPLGNKSLFTSSFFYNLEVYPGNSCVHEDVVALEWACSQGYSSSKLKVSWCWIRLEKTSSEVGEVGVGIKRGV